VKHLLKHATNRLNTLNIKMEQKIDLNSIIGFNFCNLDFLSCIKINRTKVVAAKSTKGIAN
jgi:hypothetical protein